ncbi:MAG: formate dehydrogenase major subunit [Verrucomicrobiales bacterium]|jgi:formate dehydrogenase major subunit
MPETATINGRTVTFEPGQTILQAANSVGVEIPTLCHAESLHPEGGCRMCLVACEGRSRPVAACHTELTSGMVLETHPPEIESVRRTILSLYEDSAPAAAGGRFGELLQTYELPARKPAPGAVDDSHTYVRFQADACITCRLCMNACEQIQGQFVYGVENRGPRSLLVFGAGEKFDDSPCVACGACVDLCPTGALFDRFRDPSKPTDDMEHTSTVCGYCGVGCRLDVAVKDGVVHHIDPVADAEVNRGHLCVKGRYAHGWQTSPDRLTMPLIRKNGELREVSWDEALDYISDRLTEIKDESGPDVLGAFTSSRSTNEACYLLQKLFRTEVGTNNVDCCARVCHSSTALALQLATGTGAASASYSDFEKASCLVVAGANPTEAHPVAGARIKQAALNGVPLVVIDPRRIELAEYADIHLQLLPGTNVALFNGLAKVIIEENLAQLDYIKERTEGFDELTAFLKDQSLAKVSSITNVPEDEIVSAGRLIAKHAPALFVHGLGLSELMQGVASVMTLCNLGMLTGSIGKPGAGMLPLRGQNNVQGSADMGSMPTHFTGYQPVDDPDVRERIKPIWGKLPPQEPGMPSTLMLRAAAEGKMRALWLMGEDVIQSDPNESEVIRALEKLDLIIIQDLFLTQSTKYAHVVLPSCGFLEQEGTFTNGERRIQHVRPAVAAPGEARPDWEAVRDVGARMNPASSCWMYDSPSEVMDEIATVAPKMFGGVHYDRLAPDGLQWPCPADDHPGAATLHADEFLRGLGNLVVVDYEASPEHGIAEFPYLLITGRLLDHYNVGTMTRRTPQHELVTRDELEIHPLDAAKEGLEDGSTVKLSSRWGQIDVPIRFSPRIAPGTLFLTFHYPDTHTNRVTGPTLDPQSNCPQYKATGVRLGES